MYFEPESVKLTGNTCIEEDAQTSAISINGQESLNISVNLSESSSKNIHFKPSLYNGQNQDNEFTLSTKNQAVNLGGTLTQASLAQGSWLQDAVIINNETEVTQLEYDVEVFYP